MYFNTTNSVIISLNFVAGVVMVSGELYKKWITSEFPKVAEEYNKLNNNVATIPKTDIHDEIKDLTSNGKNTDELLWEKYDQLENAANS